MLRRVDNVRFLDAHRLRNIYLYNEANPASSVNEAMFRVQEVFKLTKRLEYAVAIYKTKENYNETDD